jgi:hypothetical protein
MAKQDRNNVIRNIPNFCHVTELAGKRRCHRNKKHSNRRAWVLKGYDSHRIHKTTNRHQWAFVRFCCDRIADKLT